METRQKRICWDNNFFMPAAMAYQRHTTTSSRHQKTPRASFSSTHIRNTDYKRRENGLGKILDIHV